MNEFIKSQYPIVKVLVDNFGHDVNGNAVARHRVYGCTEKGEIGFEFQGSNRRKQIGYGGDKSSEYASIALQLAGFGDYQFSHTEGSRSDGMLWIVYKVK